MGGVGLPFARRDVQLLDVGSSRPVGVRKPSAKPAVIA